MVGLLDGWVYKAGMWITADFRLYPPVITANQELVSPTGDHRYRGGTERAHPRGFSVCCVLCAVLCCVIFEFAGGLLLGMQGYAGAPQKITGNHPGKTM